MALDASLGERQVNGAEPGSIAYGQRRAIHRLLERPFGVRHLRGLLHGGDPQRLLTVIHSGATTDAEGRTVPLQLAGLSGPHAKVARGIGPMG